MLLYYHRNRGHVRGYVKNEKTGKLTSFRQAIGFLAIKVSKDYAKEVVDYYHAK
jgi:hypothetical protein